MIKVNKAKVEVVGDLDTIIAELCTVMHTMLEQALEADKKLAIETSDKIATGLALVMAQIEKDHGLDLTEESLGRLIAEIDEMKGDDANG